MILDRHSAVPLYFQIRQQLLEQIQSGQLAPGQPLPSEHDLSQQLGISRMTARQAVKSLCDEGVAYSRPGLGTFVSGIKQEKTSTHLLSFTQEIKARGGRPGARLLSFEVVAAEASVAQALHLAKDARVYCLRRIRLVDSVPMGLESCCLPLGLCPDLKAHFDPRKSLYQTLADRYGIRMMAADEVVEAALANAEQAEGLGVKRNSAVFCLTRISYAQNGQPVEFVRSTYRGDRWKIVSRLLAAPRTAGVSPSAKPLALVPKGDGFRLRSATRATGRARALTSVAAQDK